MKTRYIHYSRKGWRHFDPTIFQEVRNQPSFEKPTGGFWGSPVNAKYGWKDWCKDEAFIDCDKETSFEFTLSDTANVIHIHSAKDVDDLDLPKLPTGYMDFEKMKEIGIDAIELHLSDENNNQLYWQFYGWDCDSILVLNKEVVEEMKKMELYVCDICGAKYDSEQMRRECEEGHKTPVEIVEAEYDGSGIPGIKYPHRIKVKMSDGAEVRYEI